MPEHSGYERSAHLYDLFDTKPNIAFFGRYAQEAGEALDIGAGTGRIAIPLARWGVKVCAVEPSPAMRSEFEHKLREAYSLQERITLVAGNAQSFVLERAFPVAFFFLACSRASATFLLNSSLSAGSSGASSATRVTLHLGQLLM